MSQSDFYAIDSVREIRLYFFQSNWDEILDSLYVVGERERLAANVVVDGNSYLNAGVRYKGFSSYSENRIKNPLNIDLDFIDNGQNHLGHKKLKLSNVIQDPSFVREALSYEVARKYMPASRANFANVYINDTLIGLYTNVEAVDELFLENHFGTSDNAFFKGNPESLDLNGENSNLSDSPGPMIDGYFPFYKLKSDNEEDWFALQEFIDTLNNSTDNISEVLNVDRALWMHALNYTMINFDSYVGYAQNYYLYQDRHGRFNPLLWDLNMSFASYRLTDASDHWDGFTIEEAKYIDPLQHLNSFSVQPRPLIRNVISDVTKKRMYLAHIRTIVEENFDNQDYMSRCAQIQTKIDSSVLADTNKFYSYSDFTANLTSTVSDLVDYPGISELMDDRSVYLLGLEGSLNIPDVSNISESVLNPIVGDSIWITADVSSLPSSVRLNYRLSENDVFTALNMMDDGLHNDGLAADGVFGAIIPSLSNHTDYYIYAENDSAGRFSPARAAFEFYSIDSRLRFNDLVVNEVMSNNQALQADQDGEFESWIEIYNTTDYTLSTTGLYLSNDSSDLFQWQIPDTTILPGDYAIIWCDQDVTQYGLHSTLYLDKLGDSLFLSNTDGTLIEAMYYPEMEQTSSIGRFPNGSGDFTEMRPTFHEKNTDPADGNYLTEQLFVYPNPANNSINVRYNGLEDGVIYFYSLDGRSIVAQASINAESVLTINTSSFEDGFYMVKTVFENAQLTQKIVITH